MHNIRHIGYVSRKFSFAATNVLAKTKRIFNANELDDDENSSTKKKKTLHQYHRIVFTVYGPEQIKFFIMNLKINQTLLTVNLY